MRGKSLSLIMILAVALIFMSVGGLISAQGTNPAQSWDLASPDQSLTITVTLVDGALTYHVAHHGVEVIHPSPLGIVREDESFADHLVFDAADAPVVIDEMYSMLSGKQRQIRNHANELTLNFHNADQAHLQIILRAYDDGVAFRYRFPETDTTTRRVTQELTGFAVSSAGRMWSQPYDQGTMHAPSYETLYTNGAPIGTRASFLGGRGWSFPTLFQVDGNWLLITEADLDGSYFGAHLDPIPRNGLYSIAMPSDEEAEGYGAAEPVSTLPWETPWRVIEVSESVGTILESNLVTNLSKSSQISDTSWIHAGRASWSWWSDHGSSRDYDSLVKYVDLAAEMGWEYSLVDANWNVMSGGSVEQLIHYANQKGVGIWLWYNSGGPDNNVTEQPRDLMFDQAIRRREFARIQALGVKGVKVDFFQSDKPDIMRLYLDILRDAADFHLMVNFHGATVPRGWARTWPNLMTMEAVRGAESYTFDPTYAATAPRENTILPFTRNAVGSMDYTPVTFTDELVPHLTTNTHELALSIVFESGILHLADSAEAYRGLPDGPKDFLRHVPVAWDETHYLAGEPGSFVVVARRSGDDWYIGGINGQADGQTVALDFSFLNRDRYSMTLIEDAADGRGFNTTTGEIKPGDPLTLTMMANGGFVIRLTPTTL